jgi:hypothetical protein
MHNIEEGMSVSASVVDSFTESKQQLHDLAIERAGSDDFGDPSYLEGLDVLLKAYDTEAKLNAFGKGAVRESLIGLLVQRLKVQAQLKAAPTVLDIKIKRPIIILGLVRTGSTALHYLMGHDPDMQCLEYWLAQHPQARPSRETWDECKDFQYSSAEIDMMYKADPSLKAIHFMMADGPEECRHLLSQHFTDDAFEVNATIPSYSEWYEQKYLGATYERHRSAIQLIGSNEPDKRWLLKYPVHMRQLDALLAAYPDACVVQTHRDPARVLPSYCSLMAGFRAIYEDNCDPKDMARRQMDLWAKGAEKAIVVRESHDPAQFYDLHFHDFMDDPIGSVKKIYAYFDQELSEEGELRLQDWQENHPQHKHGKHGYSDEIGFTREDIWKKFGTYMDAYGMQREA